jgi:hypothetical protein
MAELTATQRPNIPARLLGQFVDLLRSEAAQPEFLPFQPMTALMPLESMEKLSYGDPLFRMPQQSNIPITVDNEYLLDILGLTAGGAAAARPSARAVQDLVRQIRTEPPTGAITPRASLLDQPAQSVVEAPKFEMPSIDTAKLPASSDDIVGNPKINEDFVDLYHVTDEDSLAKIESSGVLDNTMATSNFQGYAPAIQGTYGWSSPERARFEVDRLADTIGSTEGLVILKVRVPRSEFNRLKPDEDSGIDDWRQSYLEGGSAAIEGPIPLSFVKQIYKGE